MIARLLRLPRACPSASVELQVSVRGQQEMWHRTFDGRRLDTRQYQAPHSQLAERFGVLEFRYRLEPSGGGLLYAQRDAAVRLGRLRWRIPAWCAPRVDAREDPARGGQFTVKVRVVLPGVGTLIAYDGIMIVEERNA